MWLRTSLLLAVAFGIVGCRDSGGVPLIRTDVEYRLVAEEAKKLSEDRITRFDAGEELAPDDIAGLKHAADLFEGMLGFSPTLYAPYFGAGKIYFVLGNYDRAMLRLDQCFRQAPLNDPYGKATAAEAAYLISQIAEKREDYKTAANAAGQAVNLVPISANYYAQLASVQIQLKDEKNAIVNVGKALKYDPNHKRALMLAKFLTLKPSDDKTKKKP